MRSAGRSPSSLAAFRSAPRERRNLRTERPGCSGRGRDLPPPGTPLEPGPACLPIRGGREPAPWGRNCSWLPVRARRTPGRGAAMAPRAPSYPARAGFGGRLREAAGVGGRGSSACSPGDVGVPVAAGDVQGRPACLVALVDVCPVSDQQLHALQVPRQDCLVQGCQAWADSTGQGSGSGPPPAALRPGWPCRAHLRGRACPGPPCGPG